MTVITVPPWRQHWVLTIDTPHHTVKIEHYPGTDHLILTARLAPHREDWATAVGILDMYALEPLGEPEYDLAANLETWAPLMDTGRLRELAGLLG